MSIYNSQGDDCVIVKEGKVSQIFKGIVSDNEIHFLKHDLLDVSKGDCILVNTTDNYLVNKTVANSGGITIKPFVVAYVTHVDDLDNLQSKSVINNFSFANSNNNVIGNSNNVSIQSSSDIINKINLITDSMNKEDKLEIDSFINGLITQLDVQKSVNKSFFSKFSSLLKKHDWLIEIVGKIVITSLLTN